MLDKYACTFKIKWSLILFLNGVNFLFCVFKCREESEGKLKGILGYTEDDVVSTDFIGDNRLAPSVCRTLCVYKCVKLTQL